jgi:hypothetical protein
MVMKESLVSQVDSTETLAPEAAGGERLRMAYRPGNGGFVAILSACRTFGRQVGWHIGCHGRRGDAAIVAAGFERTSHSGRLRFG